MAVLLLTDDHACFRPLENGIIGYAEQASLTSAIPDEIIESCFQLYMLRRNARALSKYQRFDDFLQEYWSREQSKMMEAIHDRA